jgi:hypothetical protein
MFKLESELQSLVHLRPEIVLGGIPEISPDYCSDVPAAISLGREIQLASGPIDNLFIDANAILTFVECKRHGDSRLKREVYAQAINYASDLKNMLLDYSGKSFLEQFFSLISKVNDFKFKTFDELLATLGKDPVLVGKDLFDWRTQFIDRLEFNIKHGVFRIVILCGASPESRFSATMLRNLMQLMTYAEKDTARYDLLLMDVSETGQNEYVSRIIWRRYSPLPQIPLLASASRDTSLGIETMRETRASMAVNNPSADASLVRLLSTLDENGYSVQENTQGLAFIRGKKSLYTMVRIVNEGWQLVRHQIRRGEILHADIENKQLPSCLELTKMTIASKTSSAPGTEGAMYEITITPTPDQEITLEVLSVLAPRPIEM